MKQNIIKPDNFKYGEWTYKLENGRHEVESPKKIPNSVFKYYSNNSNNKNALINQYLFCSHPYQLNDSMDCSYLLWDFSNLSEALYLKFYKQYGFDKLYEVNYENEKSDGFGFIKQLLYNMVTNESGIISLTTQPLHTLMWAHYSSEEGFMIELDWQIIKDELKAMNPTLNNYAFFPIQYVPNLQSIDFFDENFSSPDVPYLYSVGIKRNDWKYEDEWRLIAYKNNFGVPKSLFSPLPDIPSIQERKLFYPLKAIKSIILGKQFFNHSNVEIVINSLTYKMKTSEDLDFINFVIENLNDRIYFCGEYEVEKALKRSAEKISFSKIDFNTISLNRYRIGLHQ